jgi:hypothetical protein
MAVVTVGWSGKKGGMASRGRESVKHLVRKGRVEEVIILAVNPELRHLAGGSIKSGGVNQL